MHSVLLDVVASSGMGKWLTHPGISESEELIKVTWITFLFLGSLCTGDRWGWDGNELPKCPRKEASAKKVEATWEGAILTCLLLLFFFNNVKKNALLLFHKLFLKQEFQKTYWIIILLDIDSFAISISTFLKFDFLPVTMLIHSQL